MSETKIGETKDKEARRAARAAKPGTGNSTATPRGFTVVAHGDSMVLVDTSNGRSWTLADASGKSEWHPVGFGGNAERAPRGVAKDEE